MQYVYLIMFLVSGYYISTRIKISIEHGVFMFACSSFTVLFLLGLAGALQAGVGLIFGFTFVSFILSITHIVKNKPKLSTIFTPGIVMIIIVFITYSIATNGARMYHWDEATHWGTTVKYIYTTNKLWTSGLQTIGMPLFNYLITQVAGYSEDLLYLSQWFFQWICLSLIVSHVTYKNWIKIIIFAVGSYLGIATMMYSGQIALYADIALGIMSAGILLSWYFSKHLIEKNIIWLTPALFMLAQMKSGTGTALSIIVLIIIMILSMYNKIEKKKLVLLLIPMSMIFLSAILAGGLSDRFLGAIEGRTGSLGEMLLGSNWTYIAIALTIVAIICTGFFLYRKYKKQPVAVLLGIIPAVVCFIAWIAVGIAVGGMREGIDILMVGRTFLGSYGNRLAVYIPIWFMILSIFVGTVYQLSIKTDKKKNILFYSLIWSTGVIYTISIFLSYILVFSAFEASTCASFERYMATILIFLFISLLASIFFTDEEKNVQKSKILMIVLLGVFALVTLMYPKEQKTRSLVAYSKEFTSTFRDELAYSTRIINESVPLDEKVFIIIQDDEGYLYNWFKYELAPRKINGGYWNFTGSMLKDDGADWLLDFMEEQEYDYLYIHYSSPQLEKALDSIFEPEVMEISFYKRTNDRFVLYTN